MAGLATKKVEAEPGLVPRLAGGGSAPGKNHYANEWHIMKLKKKIMTHLKLCN